MRSPEPRAGAARELLALLRSRPALSLAAVGCTALLVAAMYALPRWAATLVRDVIPHGSEGALALHLSRGVALILAITAATFGRDFALMRLAVEFAASVRERMVERALRRPLAELGSEASAHILSRISNDVAALQHALVRGLAVFVPNVVVAAALLAAMVVVSWPLSLGVLVLVLPMLALVRFFGARLQVVVRGSQERLAEMVALARDALDGARELRAFGRESLIADRFAALNAETLALAAREERMAALHPAAVTFVGIAGLAGLVFVATSLHRSGAVGTGPLVSFLVLLGLLVGPLQESVRASGALARFAAVMARCRDVLDAPIEDDDRRARPPMPPLAGAIALDGVTLAHADGAFTLGPLSLDVAPGEVVAIVGPSGAGKSTLLDLVAGLREPTAGRVLLDGHDLAAHDRASARDRIALLTQEPFLFPGTVAENVRLARPAASDEEVARAARAAHADDFVRRLPLGYASPLERRGANLSAGQRQRVALARALLRDPTILLLDEPTSALDLESERLIVDSLRRECRGRTTLIVTHRPALLALADRVVELRDGRIACLDRPGALTDAVARAGSPSHA